MWFLVSSFNYRIKFALALLKGNFFFSLMIVVETFLTTEALRNNSAKVFSTDYFPIICRRNVSNILLQIFFVEATPGKLRLHQGSYG